MSYFFSKPISKGIIASFLAVMLSCMSFVPASFAQEGVDENVDVQSNNSFDTATPLIDGKAATGTISRLRENLVYSFRTSNRASVYECRFDAVSGGLMELTFYDKYAQKRSFFTLDDLVSKRRGTSHIITNTRGVRFVAGLAKNTEYFYEVKRRDYGSQKFKLTYTEHPILSKITKAKVVKNTKKGVKIAWARQDNAFNYQMQIRIPGQKWQNTIYKSNSAIFKNLERNTKYQVRIRPYCPNAYDKATNKVSQWGSWSRIWTFKTAK